MRSIIITDKLLPPWEHRKCISSKTCFNLLFTHRKALDTVLKITPDRFWHLPAIVTRDKTPSFSVSRRRGLSYLLVVLGGGAEDGQLWSAGLWFGRLTGVEEGLDEWLQVLSFLENRHQEVSFF